MTFNRGAENFHGNESPRSDGTPSRSSENAQLQWLIESVSQLKTSHERMADKFNGIESHLKSTHENMKSAIDSKLECIETRISSRNELLDSKIDTRHKSTDEKMTGNHELIVSKMETLELRIHKSITDSKAAGAKLYIPLFFSIAMGIPGTVWMAIQIFNAFTK